MSIVLYSNCLVIVPTNDLRWSGLTPPPSSSYALEVPKIACFQVFTHYYTTLQIYSFYPQRPNIFV